MTIPNHTAADALAQIAVLVKTRIEYAVDQIGGNIPSINDGNADQLYDSNSVVLDDLDGLVKRVIELAAPHCSGTHYTDGRAIQSRAELPDGGVFTHLWPADPTAAKPHKVEVQTDTGQAVVIITPPSSVTVEHGRTLQVAREAEKGAHR
ncbi:hypothetical protein ACFTWF_03190 [Rhodococcus sp. NPDC056960]|uniref:hypothetical protein n=1 Tax=Rhodococcus sp. NPDC056960 TaxID=3345982 RepID=UPI00363A9F00